MVGLVLFAALAAELAKRAMISYCLG